MSDEFWAIVGMGALIILTIDMAAKKIANRLETLIHFATKDRFGDE